jgi:RNA polymerase sigma factor (sigma-70 family)
MLKDYLVGKWDHLRPWEDQVLTALSVGDFPRAREALVLGFQHVVVGYCTNMLGDATQGEEIAQEVFLGASKALPSFQQKSSVLTWALAIARKQCLAYRGRAWRRARIFEHNRDAILTEVHRNPSDAPDDQLVKTEADELDKQRLEQLSLGLRKLNKNERDLLMMRYYEELSLREIAKRFWVGETTVRRRLQKAEERLKKFMGFSHYDA